MVTRRTLLAASIAVSISATVAGCQGKREEVPAEPGAGTAQGSAPAVPEDAAAESASPPEDAAPAPEEPETPDPGKVISELGAIPAWQAVIDRWKYLARRKQHGVVYGRLGPPVDAGEPSPYTWLVDDTDGHGALGIRVHLGRFATAARAGDRVALGGAWTLDDARRWYWEVDSLVQVPAAPSTDLTEPPAPVPSHAIATAPVPDDAVPISAARDQAIVTFQLVGPPPASEGDGWPIGEGPGKPVIAILRLPGEWPTYGGQDMRAVDERWQLRPKQTYWVRIGKIRRRGADQPILINARTAPVRAP